MSGAHLHDGVLAVQQAVHGIFHPVGDPAGALPHLDDQWEGGRRLALQDALLRAPRPCLLVACAAEQILGSGQVRSGQVRSGQVRSGQVKSTSGERAGRLQPRRQHYGYQEDRVVGECGSASTQARQRGSSPSVTEQMPPMRSESVGFCKHHTPHTHLSHRCALEDGCDAHKRTRGGFRAGTGRNDLSLC